MKIKDIHIQGIGGIKDLSLSFQPGMNLICGTNGVGKTTILEAIAGSFIACYSPVKRNAVTAIGKLTTTATHGNDSYKCIYEITSTEPANNKDWIHTNLCDFSHYMLYFKPHRDIGYVKLDALESDKSVDNNKLLREFKLGFDSSEIKKWFINRAVFSGFLKSENKGGLEPAQEHNLKIAKECFNYLDSDICYSDIVPDTFDIMLNTSRGRIYFEYLSSGYKSCISILIGLIKEIEYRFKDPHIKVSDFDGIILVDEIDVHLHPKWQVALVNALKKVAPSAQIIATTHSPSIIQCAEANEVIPLVLDDQGNVSVKDLNVGKYGFKGWTLEEILTDVMGMEATMSPEYTQVLRDFNCAVNEEDSDKAKACYTALDEMLHPNNILRQVLKIQMAGLED